MGSHLLDFSNQFSFPTIFENSSKKKQDKIKQKIVEFPTSTQSQRIENRKVKIPTAAIQQIAAVNPTNSNKNRQSTSQNNKEQCRTKFAGNISMMTTSNCKQPLTQKRKVNNQTPAYLTLDRSEGGRRPSMSNRYRALISAKEPTVIQRYEFDLIPHHNQNN